MILSSTVSMIKYQFRFISLFIHCPVCLIEHKNTFTFKTSKPPRKSNHLLLRIPALLASLAYVGFLFCNGIHQLKEASQRYTLIQKAIIHSKKPGDNYHHAVVICDSSGMSVVIFSIGMPVLFGTMTFSWYAQPEDFSALLNLFLSYERRHRFQGSKKKVMVYAVWFLGIIGSLFVPLSVIVLFVVKPETPPLLGSILPKIDENFTNILLVVHIMGMVYQAWQYYAFGSPFLFLTANIFLTSIYSLCVALGNIIRLNKWSQSWLRVSSIYDKTLKWYVHLKILEVQVNVAFAKFLLPGSLFIFVWVNVGSTFFIVSSGAEIFKNYEHILFVMVFGESVIIILFVGTLCGKVNQKSKTFLRQVKGAKTVGKNAQFRKTVVQANTTNVSSGSFCDGGVRKLHFQSLPLALILFRRLAHAYAFMLKHKL
ncbi:hypothetical protein Fcan01_10334 [Folsomia candida]|uniref:Uncharacterized protein n=1 Tax=Folsomia candida TaxID=158441 RepID=A0A226ECP7_FOLCA|nr:hypothetical protein Fcan01_10334 [Folsomia candida]